MKKFLQYWIDTLSHRNSDDVYILVVQTLRNVIMSASVLLSATMIVLMGVFSITFFHQYQHSSFTIGAVFSLLFSIVASLLAIVKSSQLGFQFQLSKSVLHEPFIINLIVALRAICMSAILLLWALFLLIALFFI